MICLWVLEEDFSNCMNWVQLVSTNKMASASATPSLYLQLIEGNSEGEHRPVPSTIARDRSLESTSGKKTAIQRKSRYMSELREVVSNFQESGDRSKNLTFFLFAPKDPYGELFSKISFKSSSEFLFWQKIRKFEIGQNVPNLHNFYLALSAFSQRSYKTTKIYLTFIFYKLFFIPWSSFATIFYLQLNSRSFVTTA